MGTNCEAFDELPRQLIYLNLKPIDSYILGIEAITRIELIGFKKAYSIFKVQQVFFV